jgi:hypothetical protein
LTVPTAQKTFELNLTPRDLRASRYRAENTNRLTQRKRSTSRQPVYTFKGRVAGAANSQVRLTIEGASVEGFFTDGADRFFIEPARKIIRRSPPTAIYRLPLGRRDSRPRFFVRFGTRRTNRRRQKKWLPRKCRKAAGSMRTIELATEADYEYVRSVGSAEAANNKILGILNMVEGVYESQLGLSISVVFQHTWSSPDPFSSVTGNTRSVRFKLTGTAITRKRRFRATPRICFRRNRI